ncbi:MAG: EamA family transporter [Chitinophagaceae bacterium]|nr:EamA family transporter [Chitinophagaceae bacterium]
MFFLIGSIVLTSWLTLSFKVVERLGVNTYQSIVFNYITCVVTGSFVNGAFPIDQQATKEPWFVWALVMGGIFVSLFNVIAVTTQKLGVAVASVANKLSLVIPFLFSIYLYNEEATVFKIIGIVAALVAVAFTCWPASAVNSSAKKVNAGWYLLPVVIFFASGLLDTMIKYVESSFIGTSNHNAYLITAFASAASFGVLGLLYLLVTKKARFDVRAILTGIMIGVPNYFSIWCLMHVLKENTGNSSAIIPINNTGIVLFSTVAALLLFNEKLSKLNWLGIALSVLAIALIAYG